LSGAGFPEYCLITSNTASVFTCSAGWVTDYPSIPVVNPANGTTYDIQPAWGPATVTSGTTTLTRDDTTYSGISLAIDTFFPGKIVAVVPAAVIDNMQLTRADWAQIASFPESPVEATELSVLVGSPSITAAGSAGITFNPYFVRTWTLSRNGLSEIPFMVRKDYGTRVLHWYAGQNAGGSSTTDAYVGIDPIVPSLSTPAGQGDLFILNNSSNVQKKWTFNFDGSATFPGVLTATGGTPTVSGTGACATTSTPVGGLWAGLVTCTGATGASTLVITPGITAAHGFRCPADDETTNANKLTQSTQSPTTCTIAGTVNANDVIAFGPIVAF
jgi:hypothetical protein